MKFDIDCISINRVKQRILDLEPDRDKARESIYEVEAHYDSVRDSVLWKMMNEDPASVDLLLTGPIQNRLPVQSELSKRAMISLIEEDIAAHSDDSRTMDDGSIEFRGIRLKGYFATVDNGPIIELDGKQALLLELLINAANDFMNGVGTGHVNDALFGKRVKEAVFDRTVAEAPLFGESTKKVTTHPAQHRVGRKVPFEQR